MDCMPEVIEEVVEIHEEELINLEGGDNLSDEELEEVIPVVSVKIPQLKKEDIFLREDEEYVIPKHEPNKKKRPPMTEEHKQKLAEARVKALETRRKNALEKKEIKELEKKKKQMEKQKLIDYVGGVEPPKVMKVKEEEVDQVVKEVVREVIKPIEREYITKKELEESNLQAIIKYEALRKKRKEDKKIVEQQTKAEDIIRKKLERAMPDTKAYYGRELPNDYFRNCF